MTLSALHPDSGGTVENVLREALDHGDAVLGTIAPILSHLLANDDHSIFSDEVIARVRGMFADAARQLLDAVAQAAGTGEGRESDPARIDALALDLARVPGLLGHIHALALEWQLTERLHTQIGLDPVLSPLMQALIASPDAATAAAAMHLLAAQARFAQSQRRMQLPLEELPADLLHGCLGALHTQVGDGAAAEAAIRSRFDEARSRAGLIARLITGMGGGALAALAVGHGGVAMFLSALALANAQDRDLAVRATNDSQLARLALMLRAAGMKPAAIEEQFLALHPEVVLPPGFDALGADRAAAILAAR